MKVKRLFSQKKKPFEGVAFSKRVSVIHYADGNSSEEVSLNAPENWSQIAVDIMAQKYRRKSGVPGKPKGEDDVRDIIKRMVSCWRKWGEKGNYFSSKEDARTFEDELSYMLIHQMAAPNSPQWFNTGLYDSYKIKGAPQGHYYVDPKTEKVRKSSSSYERPQPHACFIQGVKDSLVEEGGIMSLYEREARLFKFGSGSGTNFSRLRGKGEPLASGGTSSGLMGWLNIGDAAAGAIKSGGTTRRAAKMVCLDMDHPDIEEFITLKAREEEKLAMLLTGFKEVSRLKELAQRGELKRESGAIPEGYFETLLRISEGRAKGLKTEDHIYDESYEGLGYQSLKGQNANNSVRISDDFMKALEKAGEWALINRVDGTVSKTLKAQDLWELLCESAWLSADPGVQFDTTINNWHTCPKSGPIVASNPCSEYMFLDDTACNLASLNLVSFDSEEGFQVDQFIHACTLWTLVLEISVFMAQYPSPEIAKRSFEFRTLGLGFSNLGALLMRRGIPYDSEEGRLLASHISSLMGASAYKMSAGLSKNLGSFKEFKKNKGSVLKVLKKHREASMKLPPIKGEEKILEQANLLWEKVLTNTKKHGIRNAQVTAIAPTGTISLVMDCDTTGIEPDYSLVKHKALAGGGSLKIVNQSVGVALERLGYSEEEIREEIKEEILKKNSLDYLRKEHRSVFECALAMGSQKGISSEGHLQMMAAVQPFISGAISKTINLANSSSSKEISSVFKRAHALGLKALAIYRDGSKLSQPLSGLKNEECPYCGFAMLVPSGTCYKCENCGESTSCT